MQVGIMSSPQPFWQPSWYCGQQMLVPYGGGMERAHSAAPPVTAAAERRKSFTIDSILGTNSARDQTIRQLAAHPYFPVFNELYESQQLPYYHCQASPKSRIGQGKKNERCKRIRTIFTTEQLSRLEEEFAKQQYMVGSERFFLASKLRLSEAQVKVWFQNRRIKWRKQTLDRSPSTHSDSDAAFSASDADDTCSDSGSDTGSMGSL